MARKGAHKKQHFVPQCYTKAWCDPESVSKPKVDPYVWVFDKDGSNPRRRSPANLFTETDIYTIQSPDGSRDLRLEHGFQELEDKFTRIRNVRFARMEWPDDEQLVWLFAFVATAQARTAANRDHHRAQWREIRKKMEHFERAYLGANDAQRESIRRMSHPPSSSGQGMGLEEVRELEAYPIQNMIGPVVSSVMRMFGRMSTAVLCSDDPIGFLTSDHPCTWFDPEAYKLQPIFRGPGLASSTIEVTLPISPSQCLLISHHAQFQGYVPVPTSVVDELNYRHIAHCDKSFNSRTTELRPKWLERRDMPDDAWEKVRERKIASGEWPTPRRQQRDSDAS